MCPAAPRHGDFDWSFHGAISHKHLVESKRFLALPGMTGTRSAVDFERDVSGQIRQDHQSF